MFQTYEKKGKVLYMLFRITLVVAMVALVVFATRRLPYFATACAGAALTIVALVHARQVSPAVLIVWVLGMSLLLRSRAQLAARDKKVP